MKGLSTRPVPPNVTIVKSGNEYFVYGDSWDEQDDHGLWGPTDLSSYPVLPSTSVEPWTRYSIFLKLIFIEV